VSTLPRIRDAEARALAGVEPLIRPSAAATLLAVSRGEVYRLAAKGTLPCVRIGEKLIRFRASELAAYIQAGSTGRAPSNEGGKE
jgi:excisionase family DNA binding protein